MDSSLNGHRKKILLVDDSEFMLEATKRIISPIYNVTAVRSGNEALELMGNIVPDLILLDVEMPIMNGYEVLQNIKSSKLLSDIPVIFLTGKSNAEDEIYGLSLGAVDYLKKPCSPPLLLKRLELHFTMLEQKNKLQDINQNLSHLVREQTDIIVKLETDIINSIAELIEFRDGTTGGHITRTQSFLELLLKAIPPEHKYYSEIHKHNIDTLVRATPLHDVGKIAIPDAILLKRGKLTAEEFKQIEMHTILGAEIIKKIASGKVQNTFLEQAEIFAKYHHERWDGTGYPYGLKGTEIPLQGRVMAIVDVYDALTSVRPYKSAFSHEHSVKIMIESSGKHFDPDLLDLFVKVLNKFQPIAQISQVDFSGLRKCFSSDF